MGGRRVFALICAFVASFIYGTFYFSLQFAISKESTMRTIYPMGIMMFIYSLIYHIYKSVKNLMDKQPIWRKENSVFFKKTDGSFNTYMVTLIFFRGFFQILCFINFFYVIDRSNQAGISVSVIFSIGSLSSFFGALLSYIVFKEKLNMRHFIGMTMIVTAAILLGISKEQDDQYGEESISVIVPILFQMITVALFSMLTIIIKLSLKEGISNYEYTADFCLINSLIFLILMAYE